MIKRKVHINPYIVRAHYRKVNVKSKKPVKKKPSVSGPKYSVAFFEDIIRKAKNPMQADQEIRKHTNVPYEVSKAFRKKWDPEMELTPFETIKKIWNKFHKGKKYGEPELKVGSIVHKKPEEGMHIPGMAAPKGLTGRVIKIKPKTVDIVTYYGGYAGQKPKRQIHTLRKDEIKVVS